MALVRRQKLLPRQRNTRSAQIFVVATEGAQTEKIYFEYFNELAAHQPFEALPVSVTVLPPIENQSSPAAVLKQVKDFVSKHQLDPRDSVWLVLDVDRWPQHVLQKVIATAGRDGFQVAVSNPCFEVWLCFHVPACSEEAIAQASLAGKPGKAPKAKLVQLLRRVLGSHNEARPDMSVFHPAQPAAIERATRTESNNVPLPSAPGTRAYVLVREIRDSLNKE